MEHTLKFKYKCLNDDDFKEFLSEVRRQYTICIHYLVNRLLDSDSSLSEKNLRSMQPQIQNIDLIDSWYFQCAVKESIQNYNSFKKKYDEHEEDREKNLKNLEFKHSIGKISDHKYKIKKEKILNHLSLVFGGHDNMSKRQKGQITKEEFKESRLRNLYVIGEAPKGGNRKMQINPDLTLLFKYDKKHQFLTQPEYTG